jgi:organic hydroperoxide reductase OsmC/OhrA
MSEHLATVRWQRNQATFTDRQYSREHCWIFDGGAEVLASSSPQVVPVPYSNAAYVDPEEAFIAALSSCHMLWFLAIAAQQGFVVDSYTDHAIGLMGNNEAGQLAFTRIQLRPQVIFMGDLVPTSRQMDELHEEAHHRCFLANSVKTEIVVENTA